MNRTICHSRMLSCNNDFVSDHSLLPPSTSRLSSSSTDSTFSFLDKTKTTPKNNLDKQGEQSGPFKTKKVISKSPSESPPPFNGE